MRVGKSFWRVSRPAARMTGVWSSLNHEWTTSSLDLAMTSSSISGLGMTLNFDLGTLESLAAWSISSCDGDVRAWAYL